MLTQKKTSSKKTIIYVVVIVVALAVIGFVLYRTFWATSKTGGTSVVSQASIITLPAKIETDFNKKIFTGLLFGRLSEHGDLPVKVREKGKNNPFEQVE